MATTETMLTLEEYHSRGENKGQEFWFGRVIRKDAVNPMTPTRKHGFLQWIICMFLSDAGYAASTETELRVDPAWQPKPDVTAELNPDLSQPYPIKPPAIVVEILSSADSMMAVFQKCRHYERIGIEQIFIFDPEERIAWEWNRKTKNLDRIHESHLGNGQVLSVARIWAELERRITSPGN